MSDQIRSSILRHLRYSLGVEEERATEEDWRTALSLTLRDLAMDPWAASDRVTTAEDRKRVYYLSMEFLTGRLIEDAAINLGVRAEAESALADLGVSFADLVAGEPDPALGNGGLGRLAACYLESMATLSLPAFGYGLRYERGLFRQAFDDGRQVEHPDEWLGDGSPWSLAKPASTYRVSFGGSVDGDTWHPDSSIVAGAFDTPVAGYGGAWVNTLRLWAATADADLIDLDRFNAGDFFGAADAETWAKTLSRVLYPADETDLGKRLRLSQEYFFTSASVQDLLARYLASHDDLTQLAGHVAIQMNDTHPAIAGPELIRLLIDEHGFGFGFDEAADIAIDVLGYTNHTLLPEALEHWSVDLMRSLLPRHLQIIEMLDARIHSLYGPAADKVHLIHHGQVKMGELAAWTSHRVNGVSALHSELVRTTLFSALDELEPDRIVNVTNGITPRRWLALANP
ncbi:MAG: glycogen/starch/alpha-glucan phosphorylase, partial [Pseudoclavibacter sp.]